MLKYSLVKNHLTNREDDYAAQIHCMESLDNEAIITRMLNKGTLLTRTDILAVLNNWEETVEEALLEGNNLILPVFNTSFSISGIFESPLDNFDENRHKLNINLTRGIRVRETEKKVKFEKTTSALPHPQIQEVRDTVSGKVNEVLTKNGVIELSGENHKIEGEADNYGVWFVNEKKKKKKAEVIIENKPSRIIAMIPDLGSGNWQVKLITQYTGSIRTLKTPKRFIYPKILYVE
jgi:hypothetical protein